MNIFYNKEGEKNVLNISIFSIVCALLFIILLMYVLPQYRVWQKELAGKALLREAEWSKKVQIEEAIANLEAEKLNAQAEVERAKGMAEAIEIEGGALTKEYIQYLWVRQNIFSDKTTIYIPTEANLPVLEAIRLGE
ncbi:MAG: hypothetical protein PHH17_02425 [Candidatus Pacebacteria bacterium]|nr:hypothetical protein [Candidatus Paceibacterota bacterium]MDD3729068.1 hypothetical protein [Candidatus Paceibacterota bacterium]MDD5446035.1 hypothetical protein [Candidatus Paceibacterota bacterium]